MKKFHNNKNNENYIYFFSNFQHDTMSLSYSAIRIEYINNKNCFEQFEKYRSESHFNIYSSIIDLWFIKEINYYSLLWYVVRKRTKRFQCSQYVDTLNETELLRVITRNWLSTQVLLGQLHQTLLPMCVESMIGM